MVVLIRDLVPEAEVVVDRQDLLADHFLALLSPNALARDPHEEVFPDHRPGVRFHARDPDHRVNKFQLHFC